MRYNIDRIIILALSCCGIGIRGIVSLSSYSGESTPPMYGDYEAQRHWQEITYNIPTKMWYLNGSNNDLLYWGLDYPPLTAYHSFALGIVAHRLNSSYVELFQSRGYESPDHKSFMRLTVLVSDILIYIPSAFLAMTSLKQFIPKEYILSSLLLLVLYPGQILIDNGHFQYNNMSLGLFLFSVACIIKNRHNWASFFFSLALNYKQMELYHAFPLFIYLLKSSLSHKSFLKNVCSLLQVCLTTMCTFLLLWMPWISSLETLKSAIFRLFPLNRGVFEDKVANIWCSLNAVYKLKQNFQNQQMALMCFFTTLFAILPVNVHLYSNLKKKIFLYTLFNTATSFFLLSYQVHEKSILLPAIPAALIFKAMPLSVLIFIKFSTLSIFPLLIKDNLYISYFGLIILFIVIFKYIVQLDFSNEIKNNLTILIDMLDISILIISAASLYISPPNKFPYIWSFFISFICCIFFIIILLISNCMQLFSKIN